MLRVIITKYRINVGQEIALCSKNVGRYGPGNRFLIARSVNVTDGRSAEMSTRGNDEDIVGRRKPVRPQFVCSLCWCHVS